MKKEVKRILFEEGLSMKDISDFTFMSHGYVRKSLSGSAKYPHWVRVFVFAYELGKQSKTK